MANRSDREPGHPAECPRHHSLQSRVGPSSRIPSGPAAKNGCINRPDTRLHPTKAPDRQIAACNAGAIHTRHSANHDIPADPALEWTKRIKPKADRQDSTQSRSFHGTSSSRDIAVVRQQRRTPQKLPLQRSPSWAAPRRYVCAFAHQSTSNRGANGGDLTAG